MVDQIGEHGDPDVLKLSSQTIPAPGFDEVLIRVEASGVNRPDIMQRKGLYPPPPGASDIPGLEVAGEVVAINTNKSRFKITGLIDINSILNP